MIIRSGGADQVLLSCADENSTDMVYCAPGREFFVYGPGI